jgi:hypothetical protein
MNRIFAIRALITTMFILLILVILQGAWISWQSVNRPPFVLVMTPADNGAMLQFVQPRGRDGYAEVSPLFFVEVELDMPIVRVLDSHHVDIPNGQVELGDVTVTPGAFHIRFGEDVYRVLDSDIELRGISYDWSRQGEDVDIVGGNQ